MTLLQMLNFLERFDLSALKWPSVEAARLRVEAMRWAFADRDAHLADPHFAEVPTGSLLEKEYALNAAGHIHDSPTTTHISVIDAAGNAVSMTHTLGISSGVVTPGLGFSYNNYLNCFDPRPGRVNSLEPGKTRITMMVPTIVFSDEGVRAIAGAPGGTRIVGAVLQVLLNLLDHGMTPVEAVSAPRIDFQAEFAEVEGRVPEAVVAGLRANGITVHRRPYNYDSYFAQVQLISRSADGSLRGASDPRRDGGVELVI
jgi:gamma-glutamyltranspeptidase/glutathione hydrolase